MLTSLKAAFRYFNSVVPFRLGPALITTVVLVTLLLWPVPQGLQPKAWGLVAIFLERVFVVFPSVSDANTLPIGLRDVLITAGFLSLFMLSRRWFFARWKPVLNVPHPGH